VDQYFSINLNFDIVFNGYILKKKCFCLTIENRFKLICLFCLGYDDQVVAVKQLDRNGLQGQREFLVEVLMLSLLHHRNLVNLIGYCADGDQRLLVYEYMPLGSLEDHLLGKSLFLNQHFNVFLRKKDNKTRFGDHLN